MTRCLAIALLVASASAGAAAEPKEAAAGAKAVAALDARLAALLEEGTGFELRDRYDALLADAAAATQRYPDTAATARGHLIVARCCEVLGQHPEKDAAFGRYIDALVAHSKAEGAEALRREIEALVARRELHGAIKLLQLMLAKFPDGDHAAYALYRLGTCHLWLEDYDNAAGPLGEVIERWPKGDLALQARMRLTRIHFAKNTHGEAAALLEACLAQHPKTPHRPALLFDLAMARYLSADYYGALVGFQRLLREAPKSPYAPLARTCLAKLRAEVLQHIDQ